MPLQSQLRVDKLLSNISIRYQPQGYVGLQVFPEVSVKKNSDVYRVYERNFRLEETARKSGALARESDFDVSTGTYKLENHALVGYISDDDKDNYEVGNLRQDKTEALTDQILRRLENTVADKFTSTNWSLNVSLGAGDQFDDDTTTAANPLQIFDTGMTEVMQQSGFKTNFVIIPRDGFIALKNNTTYVWERIKYTGRDITEAIIEGLLDVGKLMVPFASQDSSAKGVAASLANIWTDNAFMGYKPARAGLKTPSSGYIFRQNKPFVRSWREEPRESDAIEVQMKFDVKIVASLSGFLIIDINN